VTLATLAEHPRRYVGQTIAVTAEVDRELEPSPSTGFAGPNLLGEGGLLQRYEHLGATKASRIEQLG